LCIYSVFAHSLKSLTVIDLSACDVPGIKRLLPSEWREQEFFNNIYELVGVPVVTVQLRYNGWVTELQDLEKSR
jgi:zeta-carotene desaturase